MESKRKYSLEEVRDEEEWSKLLPSNQHNDQEPPATEEENECGELQLNQHKPQEPLTMEQNINTIRKWVVFFGVLAVIQLVAGAIIAIVVLTN